MNKINDLSSWRCFFHIVERGSINLVAHHYQVEVSTISRRLSQLEKSLGYPLFLRTNQALQLTDAGRQAYEYMSPLVAQIDRLSEANTSQDEMLSGTICVSASWTLGEHVLSKWLLEFQQLHPKVVFDLKLSNRFVDMVRDGVDICIRTGTSGDDRIVAIPLGDISLIHVATSEYVLEHGVPQQTDELFRHRLLIYRDGLIERKLFNVFGEKNTSKQIKPTDYVLANSVYALYQLAREGAGIGLFLPSWLCQQALETQNLVQILPNWQETKLKTYVAMKQQVNRPKRFTQFVEFLKMKWRSEMPIDSSQ